MTALLFHRVSLEEYEIVQHYMSRYGAGSCQHSFVSMYSLFEKYGDCICEKDGFLYVLRSHLCDETYRVYLAPMGAGDLFTAFRTIFEDAHAYHKKVKFFTLTEETSKYLQNKFPGQFQISEDIDLAEYIYTCDSMGSFAGSKLSKMRWEVNRFWKLFGDRAKVSVIQESDFADILDYEQMWLEQNLKTHDMEALLREARTIKKQIDHYRKLQLSGVVIRIDGVVRGYGYGTRLSEEYYDALIEKGDRDIPHIYKVLRQESVKKCAMDCTYVNMEEDVGVPGLRAIKSSYHPEFMIRKYIAIENEMGYEK